MNRIVVLGGGESGVGAAILAKHHKNEVFVSDYGYITKQNKNRLSKYQIEFEENGHTLDKIVSADLVVKSPGIPEKANIIKSIRQVAIPIISEIEYAYRFCKGRIIGITGSNGKTTTSLLTFHILKTAGRSVGLCGNIGNSFAGELVLEKKHDIYVVEISSFQLDDVQKFSADIAILLNVTPDHLDRYNYNFDEYANSKFKIANNQKSKNLLLINGSDVVIKENIRKLDKGQVVIGIQDNNNLVTSSGLQFETKKFDLKGRHNYMNACFSIEACLHLGLTKNEIQKGLDTFVNDPHRMENVASINGITFINDSKATNVDSVYYALEALDSNLIWIVGGVDKGNDYGGIIDLVEKKVKLMICLGKDNEKLMSTFSINNKIETQKIDEAVRVGFERGEPGDVVLLSPACASFDLFDNYIDRGNQFKEAVWNII